MNRKQAILKAIEVLSTDSNNSEVIDKLKEVANEMPSSTWTRESILDSIDTYATEHNNTLPGIVELNSSNKLPTDVTIKKFFSTPSIISFWKEYFPQYKMKERKSPYNNEPNDFFIATFKQNYEKIKNKYDLKYVKYAQYEKYREPNSPCANTIRRNCNCKTYNDLLILCGYKKKSSPVVSVSHVKVTDEYDKEFYDYLKKLNSQHQSKKIG